MSAFSHDGRQTSLWSAGTDSTKPFTDVMSSYSPRSGGLTSSHYAEFDSIEMAPIPEEPLHGHRPSFQSSLFAIPPVTSPGSNKSTDELLNTEEPIGYTWFAANRYASHSSASFHIQNAIGRTDINWPLGVRSGLFLVMCILFVNAATTLYATIAFSVEGGLGTLHQGACSQVETTGFCLHILINIIGTLLLGTSNYCMQCLTSPTRKEIDAQHRVKNWLEIGILSLRNLRAIDRKRVWLWFFLGLSSFPIHLMFNSAIFVTLTANEYTVAAVTEDFLTGASWTLPEADQQHLDIVAAMQNNASQYQRLDPEDCIQAYGVDFLSDRRHVLVVTNATDLNDSVLGILDWSYNIIQNSWICGTNVSSDLILIPEDINDFDCNIQVALEDLPMTIANEDVQYCLSQQVSDVCRLQFSLPIMLIVITCNVIKLLCIVLTLMKNDKTLITMGDAIASFLSRPDPLTKGMGTTTMKDIASGYWPSQPQPRVWEYRRYFRWQSVGAWRWLITNAYGLTACTILAILLYEGTAVTTTNPDIVSWWDLGFGTVTLAGLVRWSNPESGDTGLIRNVLLANLPQLLISSLYLTYNQAYTCMAFANEYAEYFHKRHPLRVTRPWGVQKSTHFLTLPYQYILPIMVVSATMHFLLSQGFFLVAVDVFALDGTIDPEQTIMSVGFSVIALIFLIIIVGFAVFISLGMGFRWYATGMPLAGPNSAAISAACHVRYGEDGEDTAAREVQWGVVSTINGIGHLAFSSGIVSEPIPGRLYN